jgi:DNA-binding transcriptional MerR regulator
MKTIKQVADELGITKDTLRKRISREPLKSNIKPHIIIKGNTKYFTDTGVDIVTDVSMDKGMDTTNLSMDTSLENSIHENNDIPSTIDKTDVDIPMDKNMDVSMDKLFEILQTELEIKNSQLEVKDKQIMELNLRLAEITEVAATSQRLHAGTLQQQLITSTDEDTHTNEQEPKPSKRRFFGMFDKKHRPD